MEIQSSAADGVQMHRPAFHQPSLAAQPKPTSEYRMGATEIQYVKYCLLLTSSSTFDGVYMLTFGKQLTGTNY
jgi:hypothetical protein